MSAGPTPWGERCAEPERTPDGREIVRTRHGAFTREDGVLYPYLDEAEESARLEQFLRGEPRGRQGRVSLDWDVWRS